MVDEDSPLQIRELDTGGRGLRRFAARGMLVNSVFDLGLGGLTLVRGLVLAVLLSRSDFGLWGILVGSLGVLAQLKVIGIADKYIQQNESDQTLAFQRAFSLELATAVVTMAVLALLVPLIAVLYGTTRVILPGLVLCTMLLAYALQSPQWIFYRRMDFLQQRLQTAVEPVVGLIVAIALALAGAGVWSLVLGGLCGAWAGAAVAVARSPYPLAWRLDRRAISVYWRFSGPILAATLASVAMANGIILVTDLHLGLRAVGAVALATTIISFTTRVDDIIATTVYPGICAIADRTDLLRESFTKTNRLAMLWAIPVGVGLTLFAPALIRDVLGARWTPATVLIQITGLIAAINHIGFNWDDYYRARADTRPVAVVALTSAFTTLGGGIPLVLGDGLPGVGWAMAVGAATAFAVRTVYIGRLFGGVGLLLQAWRALVPALVAALAVLALRAIGLAGAGLGDNALCAGLYAVLVVTGSALSERVLLGEAWGYVLGRGRR